jgi:hypothetical protein
MHKARRAVLPITPIQPGDYDWQHPLIYFCAIPRDSLHMQGAWDDHLAPLCEAADIKAKMPIGILERYTIIPLHPLQVANVQEKFPEAYIFPEEYHVEALAQQSLRCVSSFIALVWDFERGVIVQICGFSLYTSIH